MIFVLALLACTGPNEVVVTCVTEWRDGDSVHTESYPGFTTSCSDWAEHGEVQMASTEGACAADGFDQGYDPSECACTVDKGRCTFPRGAND